MGLPAGAWTGPLLTPNWNERPIMIFAFWRVPRPFDTWCHNLSDPTAALDSLLQKASFLFVYGFTPQTPLYITDRLSDGAIADVRGFTWANLRYEVSSSEPEITREFSRALIRLRPQ